VKEGRLDLGYGRVSTEKGEQLSALTSQLHDLGRLELDEVISDVESGKIPTRAGYVRLKGLIEQGRVWRVTATAFTRLGRNSTESDAFVRLCDQHGTICRTLTEGVHTMATPEGLLLTRLHGSTSEGESMRISQRVKDGFRRGELLLRPMRRAAWGYRANAAGTALEPDPSEFPQAQRFLVVLDAHDWRLSAALRAALAWVPFKAAGSVRYWLLNPVLRGGIGYGTIKGKHGSYQRVVWGQHPPLLSHEQFAVVERQLRLNQGRWGHTAQYKDRLLTGLCFCATCGKRMTYRSSQRRHPAVLCNVIRCADRFRRTREALVREAVNAELMARAAVLAELAGEECESPEELLLLGQIEKLEGLGDADLAAAINAKRARLQELRQRPRAAAADIEALAQPGLWALASEAELRVLYLRLVNCVVIEKQQIQRIELRV
jgi:DNA invertase Pin-like site-specific DNA recombinase